MSSRCAAPESHTIPRSCASEPAEIDQPWFSGPSRWSCGTTTPSKNTSLKSARSRSIRSGSGRALTPFAFMSMISTLMPRCLGAIGVGAHEAQAVVGVMRARGPDLLAVHREVVVVDLGARREAREVAAGARLAHSQTPGDLGAQRGQQVLLLQELAAVVEDGRRDDPESLRIGGALDRDLRHLLVVDELLHRREVAAAELRRPAGHEQAGVEQLALPAARPAGEMRGARRRLGAHLLGARAVRGEPRAQLAAKASRSRRRSGAARQIPSRSATRRRCCRPVPNSASSVLARFTNSCTSLSQV